WGDRGVVLRLRTRVRACDIRFSGGAHRCPNYCWRHPHAAAPGLGGRDGTLARRGGSRCGTGQGDGTGVEGGAARRAGGGSPPAGSTPVPVGRLGGARQEGGGRPLTHHVMGGGGALRRDHAAGGWEYG